MRAVRTGLVLFSLAACADGSGDLDGLLDDLRDDGGAVTGTTGLDSGTGGFGDAGGPITTTDSGFTGGPNVGCDKMDILFVIDNSGSMSEEQANLVDNFPRFIQVLDGFRGGALSYRLGVTTTAVGGGLLDGFSQVEEGALLQTSAMPNRWLDRGAPDLTAIFTELATVGTGGSATEQPLRAAKYALVDRVEDGINAGFQRPDALLALVFLTDEDDGSLSGSGGFFGGFSVAPVSDFIAAYDGVANGRERWAASVIAGDQDPDCISDFGEASYAERLIDFVDQTGSQATFGSICSGDLSAELDAALSTFSAACDTFVPLI